MPILKFIHIAIMFMAVAASVGSGLLLLRIARARDVPAIRVVFNLGKSFGSLAGGLYVVGMIFGLITAYTGGWNLFAPWLLIAYVLFIVTAVNGGVVFGPWEARVVQAATASEGSVSTELQKVLDEPVPRYAAYFDVLILALLIFDMVIKPFS